MPTSPSPVVARRRLAVRLRQLREASGLTQAQVASKFEWSNSKIVRIENGEVGLAITDVRLLLGLYGVVDDSEFGHLLELARAGRLQAGSPYADVLSREFVRFLNYEAAARSVRHFEPLVIPGLLQTEQYMRALFRAFNPHEPDDRIERRVAARLNRQQILDAARRPSYHFIVDEAAIHRFGVGAPSRSMVAEQLARLRDMVNEDRVRLQILPFSNGLHRGVAGGFALLELGDQGRDIILYTENNTGEVVTRDAPEAVEEYIRTFVALETASLDSDNTIDLLSKRLEAV
jgi:transcriptional regulator with XRE-family HTH domain